MQLYLGSVPEASEQDVVFKQVGESSFSYRVSGVLPSLVLGWVGRTWGRREGYSSPRSSLHTCCFGGKERNRPVPSLAELQAGGRERQVRRQEQTGAGRWPRVCPTRGRADALRELGRPFGQGRTSNCGVKAEDGELGSHKGLHGAGWGGSAGSPGGSVSGGRMSGFHCEDTLGAGWTRRQSQEWTAGGGRAQLSGLGEPALGEVWAGPGL